MPLSEKSDGGFVFMVIIDWDIVDSLLEAGCDGVHVAAYFGIHPDTLYNRCKDEKGSDFSTYKAEKRAKGDLKLFVAQFDAAVKDKDRGMMIWLGKQRLDQRDKNDANVNHSGSMVINWPEERTYET